MEYRDHPPQEASFVTRVYPFGDSDAFDRALAQLQAIGGGDAPEAVWDGLAAAAHLDWRPNADHLCFLIGDSPPHGYMTAGDTWPEGCPCKLTAGGLVELLASRRIRLYAHSIAGVEETTRAFKNIAEATGGDCTEVDRPAASTAAYAHTLDATGDLVGASRAYATASAAMPEATDAEVAASLGWSVDIATGVKTYLRARGLDLTKMRARRTRKRD